MSLQHICRMHINLINVLQQITRRVHYSSYIYEYKKYIQRFLKMHTVFNGEKCKANLKRQFAMEASGTNTGWLIN